MRVNRFTFIPTRAVAPTPSLTLSTIRGVHVVPLARRQQQPVSTPTRSGAGVFMACAAGFTLGLALGLLGRR